MSIAFLFRNVVLGMLLCLAVLASRGADTFPLQRVLIADTVEKALAMEETAAGDSAVAVQDVAALADPSFEDVIRPFVGRIIDGDTLKELLAAIEAYGNARSTPVTKFHIPEQNVVTGTLRLAVEEVHILRKLLIADSAAAAATLSPAQTAVDGVVIRDVALLDTPEFRARVQPFFGKPIDSESMQRLAAVIEAYARENDRLVTKVEIANQSILGGVLRMGVLVGRYNQLAFRGNRWFSRTLLEQKLGIKPGDEVRLSTLEEAVNWANANPFRQIRVLVNDLKDQPGKADLWVAVQEARPLRFAFSYDDYGAEVLGRDRFTGVVQFGNLWGRDHQGFYQFLSGEDPTEFSAHVAEYRVPLPWRHYIQASGVYSKVDVTLPGGHLAQQGESTNASLRYTVPLRSGTEPAEVFFGFDYKSGNNSLEGFGQRFFPRAVETLQFAVGASTVKKDSKGTWAFSGAINLSPGGITSRNTTRALRDARSGAVERYAYGTASVQRLQNLPKGWELTSRLTAQLTTENLVPSEQLSVGGAATARGYNASIYTSDQGFVFNTDLVSPSVDKTLSFLPKRANTVRTRFAAFYDTARVQPHRRTGEDPPYSTLVSAGIGVRVGISSYFNLNFDYGWQLNDMPVEYRNKDQGRGHLKAVLAF